MLSDAEQIDILRRRVSQLEKAILDWDDVLTSTGEQRQAVYNQLMEAMMTDWSTAILSDPDMTPEQRAYWLSSDRTTETDQEEAGE